MGDGIVANFFYNLLKEGDQIHYSELLEHLQCSDCEEKTFFDTYTDYGRRWFFEVNSTLFRISDDGYVSLIDEVKRLTVSRTRKSSQKENDQAESLACGGIQPVAGFESNASSVEAVIEDLVFTLWERGSVHFLDLTMHQSRGSKINVSQYFQSLSSLKKFLFFKNRFDMFNIDDKGYVTLKTSAPVDFDKGRKTDRDNVVDFFTSILRITRNMDHRKLVKLLQESNLDVKDYFDSCSDGQIKKFFQKQASLFQLGFYFSVSLQEEAVDCVEPDEVGKTTNAIESNSDVNSYNIGRQTKIVNEKALVKAFISTLKEYGPMHYNALTLCTKQKAKYFKKLTALEKISFFKDYADTFLIVNNGYVSLNNETGGIFEEEKIKESQVIEFFVSILRSRQRTHRDDLGKLLKHSELDAKDYFGKISGRKLKTFFSKHRSVFRTEKHGFISLQENIAEFSECTEKSANVSVADEVQNTQIKGTRDICFVEERGDRKFFSSSSDSNIVEENVIETLIATLLEYGSMHYLALLKCAYVSPKQNKKYFDELSKDDVFFRNHQEIFIIGSDGYVTLTDLALNGVKPKEIEVLDYFTSLLRKSPSLPPHALVRRIKKSELRAKDYFDSSSFTDVLDFFGNHPSRFVLRREINISLAMGVMKSTKQKDSSYARQFDGGEAAKIRSNSGVLVVNSSIPLHMENREYCGKAENSVFGIDETENILLPDDNVNYQPEKVMDWIFSCEEDQESSSNSSEDDSVHGGSSSLSMKSTAACGFEMADSKLDSFTFDKEGKRQERNVSKNEISRNLADDCEKNPVMNYASSGSSKLENTAKSELLCTNRSSDSNSYHEARSIAEAKSVVSSTDEQSDSRGMDHLNDVLSLTDSHIQSIRYFVVVLKDRYSTHYHQLLYKACSFDRNTFNFFSKFTLADVLEFIRMHWMYFSIQDGNVTLVDPTIAPSTVLTSEDHVLQVTSVVDAKAVDFFVNLLRQRTLIALIELKFYLGFAPGCVLSFFAANFHGDDFFKFFQRHRSYFKICDGEFVILTLEIW